jgi:hypothetical protein
MNALFVPPDPGPAVLFVLVILSMCAKLHEYRATRNIIALAESGIRLALAIFYGLIVWAGMSNDFRAVFTEDLWRIYARWGLIGLFLVEVLPWLITVIKQRAVRRGKQRR